MNLDRSLGLARALVGVGPRITQIRIPHAASNAPPCHVRPACLLTHRFDTRRRRFIRLFNPDVIPRFHTQLGTCNSVQHIRNYGRRKYNENTDCRSLTRVPARSGTATST